MQPGAGADHHRCRSELDRDLGGILAVILGVEASRTTSDSINQAEGAAVAEAAAAIFHLLIRRPLNRTPAVHHATHFLPATFPTATRLHLFDRGSLSRWETPPHQRYEEHGGYELANYAGGGYGDGSWGGAEGEYDYGHLCGGGEFHQ